MLVINPQNLAVLITGISEASTIDNATLVLCQCTTNTQRFAHITNAAGDTRIANFMIPAGENIIVVKNADEKIFGSSGINGGTGGTGTSNVVFTKLKEG